MKCPGVNLLYKEQLLAPQECLSSLGLLEGSALTAVLSAPTWDLNLRNASARGAEHVVDWLLEKDDAASSVNETDEGGWTPLMFASDQGHEQIVARLLGIDADVNAQSHSGKTAVKLACRGGHCKVVEKLIDARADVSGTLHYGTEAIWYPQLEKILTAAGADK
jgi:ankyrin repeat protein